MKLLFFALLRLVKNCFSNVFQMFVLEELLKKVVLRFDCSLNWPQWVAWCHHASHFYVESNYALQLNQIEKFQRLYQSFLMILVVFMFLKLKKVLKKSICVFQ